ncbi:Asp23/Gls24 family envelope stress response protein [Streptomyces sp. NPDC046939]|uniref:Asp23/Gls24 family envelope stress response protein n=1 Tax=Streptomyces sp. NPDC046939 TaxID=3155376 RepID=UPI0033FA4FDD
MSDIGTGTGSATTAGAQRKSGQSGGTRGTTTIADGVVAKIAGVAIRETDGVRSVGKGASKALGAVSNRLPGSSSSPGRSVKAEVDEEKVSISVDVEVEYGVPIHELAKEIRARAVEAVESMTGLDVTEIDINVFDVHVPDDDEDDAGSGGGSGAGARLR